MNVGTIKKLLKNVPDKTEIEIPYKAVFGKDEFKFSPLFLLVKQEIEDEDEELSTEIQLYPIGLNEYMEREEENKLLVKT